MVCNLGFGEWVLGCPHEGAQALEQGPVVRESLNPQGWGPSQ